MLPRKMIKSGVLAAAALGAGFFVATPAQAKLVLTLSETGFTTQTLNGTVSGGFSSVTGTNAGALPSPSTDFAITIANGESNEPSGSGSQAVLESTLLTITDSNTHGNAVTITVSLLDSADPNNPSDVGWVFPGSNGSLMELDSTVSGSLTKQLSNGTDSITYQSFANGTVTAGPQTATFVNATAANNPDSVGIPNLPTLFTRGSSFSLGSTITVTLSNAGDSFTVGGITTAEAVPEPTTLLGLVGCFGLLMRTKRRAR
jgi:hypothetical protein